MAVVECEVPKKVDNNDEVNEVEMEGAGLGVGVAVGAAKAALEDTTREVDANSWGEGMVPRGTRGIFLLMVGRGDNRRTNWGRLEAEAASVGSSNWSKISKRASRVTI